jgi:uncharacterized membrane protein (TIGR02234 family)
MSPGGGRLREVGVTVVVGLLGALAVTVAMTRPWIRATAEVPGLPTIEVDVSGATLSPVAGALGVVLLASFGAVIATRGWVRRALGGLVVVASIVVLASAVATPDAGAPAEEALSAKGWTGGAYVTEAVAWRWLALAGGICCLLAGIAVAVRGHRWPVMGSRYDAPAATTAAATTAAATAAAATDMTDASDATAAADVLDEADLWRALDRGQDPTRDA